jgi:hypothetical protein
MMIIILQEAPIRSKAPGGVPRRVKGGGIRRGVAKKTAPVRGRL